MVFVFVLLTAVVFIAGGILIRKEDKTMKEAAQSKKSPIFLSPEKSLLPVNIDDKKYYHLSHSWMAKSEDENVLIGFDNFISTLFASEVKIQDLPLNGTHISQGTKIWNIKQNDHHIEQLSPISGKVISVNPACFAEIPLPSEKIEKSWIVKMKPDNLEFESNNLMKHAQAVVHNYALKDELIDMINDEKYMNDGGQLDSEFIRKIPDEDWNQIIEKFFPYQKLNEEV